MTDVLDPTAVAALLAELAAERGRQDAKWGDQSHHRDGTGGLLAERLARITRDDCEAAGDRNELTWRLILREEVYEAFAETDATALRTELLQVAAVALAWCQALDARGAR